MMTSCTGRQCRFAYRGRGFLKMRCGVVSTRLPAGRRRHGVPAVAGMGLRPGVDLSNAALAEAMNDGVSVDAVR